MRKLLVVLVILAVTAMAATSATAGLISWSGYGITASDADVSTNGTLHDAVQFSSNATYGSPTINGTFFHWASYPGPVAGGSGQSSFAGKIQTSMTSDADKSGSTWGTNGRSYAYSQLISYVAQADADNASVAGVQNARDLTISGLTAGNGYEIQAWCATESWSGRWLYFNQGQADAFSTGSNWAYAKGTFTADAATKTLTWGGGQYGSAMNAMQVRLISTATPEPSTIALLATGLMALVAYAWRKRR